jgi:hypothetical protein
MAIYATFKSGQLVPPKIRLFIDSFREQMKGPPPDIAR